MGFNIAVACHTCREECGALRTEEAEIIAKFADLHPTGQGHRKDIMVDNGFAERAWDGVYTDTYEQVKAHGR